MYPKHIINTVTMTMISASFGTSDFPTATEALATFWQNYHMAIVGCVFIIPIVVRDLVKLTHRFAGPMLRMRRLMKQVANGEHVEPVRFRDGDFWQDFAVRLCGLQRDARGQVANCPKLCADFRIIDLTRGLL